MPPQSGILAPIPQVSRYLIFNHGLEGNLVESLRRLQEIADGENMVVGLGQSLLSFLGSNIRGMHDMPALSGVAIEVPSTPASLWVWLRGEDRGDLVQQTLDLKKRLGGAFEIREVIDGFKYRDSRDLSGYEDGTENPEGDEAIRAAFVDSGQDGLDGSSFVAVQQWLHNLNYFQALPTKEQDNIIGRHVNDNAEFDEAPESAHVKRAAQESFSPEAFVVRRSMPWADSNGEGLVFTAFGHSFQAFESILSRMVGLDDGITDGLFRFTQPISGAYFWCPPMHDGKMDLRLLGISSEK